MKNELNQEMLYMCGKCGHEIKKDDKICPHCGARLGKIQCPYCNFSGDEEDFKKDICPKCGHHKTLSLPVGEAKNNKPQKTTHYTTPKKFGKSKISQATKNKWYKICCLIMSCLAIISIIAFVIYFKLV